MLCENDWPELGEQSTSASNVQLARTEQQWVRKQKEESHNIPPDFWQPSVQGFSLVFMRKFWSWIWKVLEINIQTWAEFQKEKKNPKLKETSRKQSKSYWVIQLLHEKLTFSCSIIFFSFFILEVSGRGKWEDVPGEQILWATAAFPPCLSPAWDTAQHILHHLLCSAEPLCHRRFSQEKRDSFTAACGEARENSSGASTG